MLCTVVKAFCWLSAFKGRAPPAQTALQIVFTIGICRTWTWLQLEEQLYYRVGRFKFNSLKLRSRRQRAKRIKNKKRRVVNLKGSSIGSGLSRVLKTVFRAVSSSLHNKCHKNKKGVRWRREDSGEEVSARQFFVYLWPSSGQQNRQKSHLSPAAKRKSPWRV